MVNKSSILRNSPTSLLQNWRTSESLNLIRLRYWKGFVQWCCFHNHDHALIIGRNLLNFSKSSHMGTIGSFWRVLRRLFIHCSREKLISPLFFSIFSRNTKYWTFSYRQLKTLGSINKKEFLKSMSDSSFIINRYSTGKLLFLLPYVKYLLLLLNFRTVRPLNYGRTVSPPYWSHYVAKSRGTDHIWHYSRSNQVRSKKLKLAHSSSIY